MKNLNQMIASLLFAGVLASVSAFADETPVPQDNAGKGQAVEQLKQDKATVKADREKLQTDRKKLREDRAKLRHKGRKHRKDEKKVEQPKS